MQLHLRRLPELVHCERDHGDLRPLHVHERTAMLRLLQLLDHRRIGMDPIGGLHHPLRHRRDEDHAERLRGPVTLCREPHRRESRPFPEPTAAHAARRMIGAAPVDPRFTAVGGRLSRAHFVQEMIIGSVAA